MRIVTVSTLAAALFVAACGKPVDKPAEVPAPADVHVTVEAPVALPDTPPAAVPAPAPVVPDAAPVSYASITGDATRGEVVFSQCKACHVADQGVNRIGPSLYGVVGRTAGQIAGFNYSAANKGSGIVWTPEVLYAYLEAPQKYLPGTRMAFGGLKKPQDRADVIAYLKTKG